MKKFVISTHSFDFGIGGLKVLHKLCDLINKCGREAFIAPCENFGRENLSSRSAFYLYKNYNTPIINTSLLDPKEYIAIYPESWYGNHTGAKNVVRWILGPYDIDRIKTWNDKDLWFWYLPLYQQKKYNPYNITKNLNNILYVAEFHKDIFYNKNYERKNKCWTLRKAKQPDVFSHPSDALFIPYHQTNTEEIFNLCTEFYCYDTYTFLPIQALMCGCESIVIPDKNLPKSDFMAGAELNQYVAYGLEDLDRARSLRNNMMFHIDTIENNVINHTKNFIDVCEQYFS